MEMEKIGKRIYELKKLGAGDQQCEECLHTAYPVIHSMEVCKKCIAESVEFTDLVESFRRTK